MNFLLTDSLSESFSESHRESLHESTPDCTYGSRLWLKSKSHLAADAMPLQGREVCLTSTPSSPRFRLSSLSNIQRTALQALIGFPVIQAWHAFKPPLISGVKDAPSATGIFVGQTEPVKPGLRLGSFAEMRWPSMPLPSFSLWGSYIHSASQTLSELLDTHSEFNYRHYYGLRIQIA